VTDAASEAAGSGLFGFHRYEGRNERAISDAQQSAVPEGSRATSVAVVGACDVRLEWGRVSSGETR
jgi:hypothetical protein